MSNVIDIAPMQRRRENAEAIEALDALALALAEHDHCWTEQERQQYERAIAALSRTGCDSRG
ncbi:MAG: hypothetical protein IT547_16025 [Hyphomonadaceae bacterium]|nr:hypothetical protein [Hyphomonadaceae bacterium]